MESPYEVLKRSMEAELRKAADGLGYLDADPANTIVPSKAQGDISCSIAFRISNAIKKPPSEISSNMAARIGSIEYVSKVSSDNGFINFYLDRERFSKDTISYIKSGSPDSLQGNGKRLIVEYVSVNPVHPWHVGHLRNALIGDVVANLYERCGYIVERQNYMDNLGLQAAEAMWGTMNIDKLSVKQGAERRLDYSIGEVYVATNRLLEKDPGLIAEVKKVLSLAEQDGTYESKLAREMAEGYLSAERQTAFSYGIYQDVVIWESDIVKEKLLEKMLEMLARKGITKKPTEGKYKGCVVIELADLKDLPKELTGLKEEAKVLIRSDGSANYIAKDIAFHMWKLGIIENSFKFSKFMERQPNGEPLYTTSQEGAEIGFGSADGAITVTDSEQKFEQLLVKVVISALGERQKAEALKHIGYGIVTLEGAKLSGRKGTWVGYTADDLLREAKERARSAVKPNDSISAEEREVIAEKVAVAAIKFEFLKISPEKNITFSWERALNFNGGSGPYCQYTYARASRILEKSGTEPGITSPGAFEEQSTFSLVKLMALHKEMIEKACREDRPNVITDYLSELAVSFSKFYESVPVLKGDEREKAARLSLVAAFRNVMKEMLGILGIEAIEKM